MFLGKNEKIITSLPPAEFARKLLKTKEDNTCILNIERKMYVFLA